MLPLNVGDILEDGSFFVVVQKLELVNDQRSYWGNQLQFLSPTVVGFLYIPCPSAQVERQEYDLDIMPLEDYCQ